MSTPFRMCVVCRQMKTKPELLRVVKKDGGVFVDTSGKSEGRGAYICKNSDCCEKFENSMIAEMKTLRPEEFSDNFSNFDKDGDGKISADEMNKFANEN